jgi:Bacterial Ig-like domain (group 2)
MRYMAGAETGAKFRRSTMFDRIKLGALLLIGLALPIMGCGSAQVDTLEVTPTAVTMVVGATAQLSATGVYSHGSGPSTTQDLTNEVTWSTASADVATVSATGMVTGVGAGTVIITASIKGYTGLLTATSTVAVTSTSTGTAGGDVVSLDIIPGSQTLAGPNLTATFLAVGTTASGATVNVNSQVLWGSSSNQIVTIGASSGIATSAGQGTATITAVYTNADHTVATGTATLTVTAGASADYTALTILPSSQTVSASQGVGNFIALATLGSTGLMEDVTANPSLQWLSSIPALATISTAGVAMGASPGTTTIEALLTNKDNSVVSSTASLDVTLTAPPLPILSLTVIPGSVTFGDASQESAQFLAIATYSTAPYVRDVTNAPSTTWLSSEPEIFTVGTNSGGNSGASAGLVTDFAAYDASAVIIAESLSPGSTASSCVGSTSASCTIQSATATISCPEVLPPGTPTTPPTCYPGQPVYVGLLQTLTVYNEGLNTTNWEVTASSATGTPDVIHCGPGWTLGGGTGGSVCTATYPVGTTVTLTATQPAGVTGTFGGWSYNCTPVGTVTAASPNSCTVVLNSDDTVGAIFN